MSKRGHEFRWKPPGENGTKSPSWKEMYRQRFLITSIVLEGITDWLNWSLKGTSLVDFFPLFTNDSNPNSSWRCMDRLRENRFRHLVAKRQLDTSRDYYDDDDDDDKAGNMNRQSRRDRLVKDIQTMMTTEWEQVQMEDASEKGIVPENIPAPSVDEMITLMEDILDDLRQEKSRNSNEDDFCEEHAHREEEELCQAFDRMRAVEVICPICQKDCLQEEPSVISCKCGLHIDTEHDCISLKNVSDNLRSGTTEHELQCEQKPSFSQMDGFGISTLIMTCQDCDFHYIIV